MDTSIIVCTYNRADSLQLTLESLKTQTYDIGQLEVLVVDNNSNDATHSVYEQVAQSSPIPMRYLYEGKQGLSHARNAGIAASQSDIVIFIDDDACPLDSDWAQRLAKAFENPQTGAAGGDALPAWPTQGHPAWLHDRLLPYLGIVKFPHTQPTALHYPHYPYGVNIAFRRSLFEEIGLFSTAVGRIGNVLLSGEEIDLCRRVEQSDRQVMYVPQAAVNHSMAPGRLTHEWFLRRAQSQGTTKASLEITEASRLKQAILIGKRATIYAAALLAQGMASLIKRQDWKMVARCRATMSLAYLQFAKQSKS